MKDAKASPVFYNRTIINTNKPVSLIIGLGFEEKYAEFLINFFRPTETYLFMPNPAFDDEYTKLAEKSNRQVLKNINNENLIYYPASNIEVIDEKLKRLCMNLRLSNRVIIVSQGPKTFSFASLLLNARYPDIEIWQLSCTDLLYDLKPAGIPIVYKAIMENSEE